MLVLGICESLLFLPCNIYSLVYFLLVFYLISGDDSNSRVCFYRTQTFLRVYARILLVVSLNHAQPRVITPFILPGENLVLGRCMVGSPWPMEWLDTKRGTIDYLPLCGFFSLYVCIGFLEFWFLVIRLWRLWQHPWVFAMRLWFF